MSKQHFFIAGRWRNRDTIKPIVDAVRASGHTAYCFIENAYEGETFDVKLDADPDVFMAQSEAVPQDDPLIRQIFETDIAAERAADIFLLVLPAGANAHIEAGAAYGMGKKCYAVGKLEKTETLYCIFEQVFADRATLEAWLETI